MASSNRWISFIRYNQFEQLKWPRIIAQFHLNENYTIYHRNNKNTNSNQQ